MTPRKTARRQPNNQPHTAHPLANPYDYDSDIQYVPPPPRTNGELNLSVLRKYKPSIRSILSIAASAVVYNFNPPSETEANGSWEKAGIDGPLFVCEQEPNPVSGAERFCVAILNRRGLDSVFIELSEVLMVELTGEYLLIITPTEDGGSKGRGLWMHPDKDDTREVNNTLIEECWKRATVTQPEATGMEKSSSDESWNIVGEQSGMGRKLSLRDLFGQQNPR
ncbi:hypothetical protein BP6252_00425 [Coleophoma cylindrospora]|uniref:Uncharacterized protein n=1 Tax=Coleophoma cylindrospora TaxID=1849047 RepID=A0A3D8SPZ3_9HELO|nr:hypothetical protein BP6252_00425 [Coleophoma cylindrospora]